MKPRLAALDLEQAFAPHLITDRDMAQCCLAGVWLRFDFLDESHRISQSIETPSGSFWHAIMHRREGDFDNAKYWFRRMGRHPVLEQLAPGWDPFTFVDRCRSALEGATSDSAACRELQRREWELLFDFCYRGAISSGR
jgi:hypothetical protein